MNEFNNVKPFSNFGIAFQITKKVMFEVYYTRSSDGSSYFYTIANVFNQPKTDFSLYGQCQEDCLPHDSIAYSFYKKWDKFHLLQITDEETYNELIRDVTKLMESYNYTIGKQKLMHFEVCKELSMRPIKRHIKK